VCVDYVTDWSAVGSVSLLKYQYELEHQLCKVNIPVDLCVKGSRATTDIEAALDCYYNRYFC